MNNLITYGFVAGRVKYLEGSYLSVDDFERLIEAENLEELRSILANTFYSFLAEEKLTEEKEVKHKLELMLVNHFKDLTFHLSDKRVCQALLSLFDLQNFKILFKERFFGLPALNISPLASFSREEMRKVVFGEEEAQPYSQWVAEAEKITEQHLLDSWLEKVCSLEKLRLARSLKSEVLEQWAREEIRILNYKAIWRFKHYQPSFVFKAEDFLVLETAQEKSYYLPLLELSFEDFLLFLKSEMGADVRDEFSLESALLVKFNDYLKRASLKVADPALIYFYLARRVKEAELIQMAVFSQLRNWDADFLKRAMEGYV